MNAAVDPAPPRLLGRLPEAGELAFHPVVPVRADGEGDFIGPEEAFEDAGGGTGKRAMARDVGRERGRGQERQPVAVGLLFIIDLVGGADRRHRTPELVAILAVPTDDGSVGQGDVQEREEAGVLRQGRLAALGDFLGDLVPVTRRRAGARVVIPEPGDDGLLGRPTDAALVAEALHLRQVADELLTAKRRRRRGADRLRLVDAERCDLAPGGEDAGGHAGRRGPPHAGGEFHAMGRALLRPVVATPGEDAVGDVAPQGQAARARRADRGGGEGRVERLVETLPLLGVQVCEDALPGGGDGDFGVDWLGRPEVDLETLVGLIDRVDRIDDRDVEHRQVTRGDGRRRPRLADRLQRDAVPHQDGVLAAFLDARSLDERGWRRGHRGKAETEQQADSYHDGSLTTMNDGWMVLSIGAPFVLGYRRGKRHHQPRRFLPSESSTLPKEAVRGVG